MIKTLLTTTLLASTMIGGLATGAQANLRTQQIQQDNNRVEAHQQCDNIERNVTHLNPGNTGAGKLWIQNGSVYTVDFKIGKAFTAECWVKRVGPMDQDFRSGDWVYHYYQGKNNHIGRCQSWKGEGQVYCYDDHAKPGRVEGAWK